MGGSRTHTKFGILENAERANILVSWYSVAEDDLSKASAARTSEIDDEMKRKTGSEEEVKMSRAWLRVN